MATSYDSSLNRNFQKNDAAGWDNDTGINVNTIYTFVSDQTEVVNSKLTALKAAGSTVSITDMFEMQMKMNRLSQFSEMATAVVSAAGAAIQSVARNVK